MTYSDFVKYVDEKIMVKFSLELQLARKRKEMIETALSLNADESIQADKANKKILPSLKNHFDKLINDLYNPSDIYKIKLNRSETLTPYQVYEESFKAVLAFLKIADGRNGDGIRNAYISFARARRQKYVRNKSENNDGDGRRGRPNLYTNVNYKCVVNHFVKIKNKKAK